MIYAALVFLALALLAAGVAIGWLVHSRRQCRPLHFVRTWKPLSEEQIAIAMSDWREGDAKWRALVDTLGREIEGTLATIAATETEPLQMARWAGRIDMALHLRQQLVQWRKQSAPIED